MKSSRQAPLSDGSWLWKMYLYLPSTAMRRYILIASAALVFIFFFAYNVNPGRNAGAGLRQSTHLDDISLPLPPSQETITHLREKVFSDTQPLIDNVVLSSGFGEMGKRTETLIKLMQELEQKSPRVPDGERSAIEEQMEKAITSLYPYLRNPAQPEDKTPLATLRNHYRPGSKGIVIPAGKEQFRFTLHLISNIRNVLGSKLEIQVAYAGDEDLPADYRKVIESTFNGVETLDVLQFFDDTTLNLRAGGWAIKPFAMLASKFENVILADADAVFVQQPDVIFEQHQGYQSTGALLFHDRLLWQNVFRDRAKWWKAEMGDREPSEALQHSKVWTEGYAEEGDSGVIALDKGRLPVLMALLHIGWQNSQAPRDTYLYKLTYGDKESWWFGLELCRVPFVFEEHYGAVLGQTKEVNGEDKVCGFVIAHADEKDRLLWYNGSLLKNKAVNKNEYWTPDSWMVDAEWQKGATKPDMSCMRGGQVRKVPAEAMAVIQASVKKAKELDAANIDLIGSLG